MYRNPIAEHESEKDGLHKSENLCQNLNAWNISVTRSFRNYLHRSRAREHFIWANFPVAAARRCAFSPPPRPGPACERDVLCRRHRRRRSICPCILLHHPFSEQFIPFNYGQSVFHFKLDSIRF